MSAAILRFAPSPNGRLHLGHAYSALLNDRIAARLGGGWLLRIEDIDPARSRLEYEAAIAADLAWLGLVWPQPVRRQSEHMAEYGAAFASLRRRGLCYRCVCTRAEIAAAAAERGTGWPRDPDGAPLYPGTCRILPGPEIDSRVAAGHPAAWRIDMEAAIATAGGDVAWTAFAPDGPDTTIPAQPRLWGDAVIVRKDTSTSYHLSVVVDDAAQGITHVVRGADLAAATDLQALLQRLLGLAAPRYHHHRLIRDQEGAKLSKRFGSRSLGDLRAAGAAPADIEAALGFI